MQGSLHISLAPDHLFNAFGVHVSNTMATAWFVSLVLIIGAFLLRRKLTKVPGKVQSVIEMIYDYFMDSAVSIIGRRDIAQAIFPFIMTLFFFIVVSNWVGLLPSNHAFGLMHDGHLTSFLRQPTTDLNMVLALALMAVGYVQYIGLRFLGFKGYLGKFFDFSSPIAFFVGILELISEFTRIISYTFRLFGNIFAGMVLVSVIFYLNLSLVQFFPFIPLPFYILELFVGVVQAFVFCFLVIVLSALAASGHGDHADHPAPAAAEPAQS